jgi:hypothetical protein
VDLLANELGECRLRFASGRVPPVDGEVRGGVELFDKDTVSVDVFSFDGSDGRSARAAFDGAEWHERIIPMNTQTRRGFFATLSAAAAGGWAVLTGRKALGRPVPDVPLIPPKGSPHPDPAMKVTSVTSVQQVSGTWHSTVQYQRDAAESLKRIEELLLEISNTLKA